MSVEIGCSSSINASSPTTNNEIDNIYPDQRQQSSSENVTAQVFRKHEPLRDRLHRILHSHNFHLAVCLLIILDIILIIIELLGELRLLEIHGSEHDHSIHEHSFRWARNLSILLLLIFLVEIFVKVYVFGCIGFLKQKLEVLDAIIVCVSLTLDVAFYNEESAAAIGSGLIISLRLWRVGRLLNGIVMTVKKQAEAKLANELRLREHLKQRVMVQRDYCNALEQDNQFLRGLLKEHGIVVPPSMEPLDDDSSQ